MGHWVRVAPWASMVGLLAAGKVSAFTVVPGVMFSPTTPGGAVALHTDLSGPPEGKTVQWSLVRTAMISPTAAAAGDCERWRGERAGVRLLARDLRAPGDAVAAVPAPSTAAFAALVALVAARRIRRP